MHHLAAMYPFGEVELKRNRKDAGYFQKKRYLSREGVFQSTVSLHHQVTFFTIRYEVRFYVWRPGTPMRIEKVCCTEIPGRTGATFPHTEPFAGLAIMRAMSEIFSAVNGDPIDTSANTRIDSVPPEKAFTALSQRGALQPRDEAPGTTVRRIDLHRAHFLIAIIFSLIADLIRIPPNIMRIHERIRDGDGSRKGIREQGHEDRDLAHLSADPRPLYHQLH